MSHLKLVPNPERAAKIEGINLAFIEVGDLLLAKISWYKEKGGSMSGIRIACLEAFFNEVMPANQKLVKEFRR